MGSTKRFHNCTLQSTRGSITTLYNLPRGFSKFSSSCLHYLRGFSNLHSQVYQRFLQVFYPLHNSTSFNLPRDLHSLFTILHSTKKHWDSLNNSTLKPTISSPSTQTQEINSKMKH